MASSKPPKKRKKRKPKTKLSEMVLHRKRDAEDLIAAIEAFRGSILEGLAKRYGPLVAEGEALPDFAFALDLTIREVQTAIDHLSELNREHTWHKAKAEGLRHERDRLVNQEACPRLVSVRGSIDATLGREAGRLLHGLKGKTPRRMPRLGQALDHLVGLLEDPEVALPRSGRSALAVDRELWLAPLRGPRKRLADNAKALRETSQLEEKLRIYKTRAMDAFDEVYAHCLRDLKAMMIKARLDTSLLKHLRPLYQRRRNHKRARQKRDERAAAKEAAAAAAEAGETGDGLESSSAEPEAPAEPRAPAGATRDGASKSGDSAGRAALRSTVAGWLRKKGRGSA